MPNLGTAEVGITKPMGVAKSTRPRVMAVMLTKDRPEMAARAVRCFRAQTYENKRLLIWDAGKVLSPELASEDHNDQTWVPASTHLSIGNARNQANSFWTEYDIACHFDDDDWSHPRRIEEQVALLELSGKECVGYNEMLFWRITGFQVEPIEVTRSGLAGEPSTHREFVPGARRETGEAWRYRLPLPGYALGTSLCYWRRAWARHPFPDKSNGEDWGFLKGVSCESASAFIERVYGKVPAGDVLLGCEPRMIATLHGSNTATRLDPSKSEWTREPEWDKRVREILERA